MLSPIFIEAIQGEWESGEGGGGSADQVGIFVYVGTEGVEMEFLNGTGGAVPALVAQHRHWWRSTGTGGTVPALVPQCVKGLSLGRAVGSRWGPGPGSILA